MDLNLNINVQFSVTPELATLIGAMLDKGQCQKRVPIMPPASVETTAPESDKPQKPRKPKTEAKPSEQETAPANEPTADTPTEDTNAPASETTAEAVPEAVAAAQAAAEAAPKPLTEEDIRAAMHRTRQRFEGADYKENTDSEYYKKYHRQLTSTFKGIAAFLGADKPSALPVEQRAAFIAACDELVIDENGNISTPPAPF